MVIPSFRIVMDYFWENIDCETNLRHLEDILKTFNKCTLEKQYQDFQE